MKKPINNEISKQTATPPITISETQGSGEEELINNSSVDVNDVLFELCMCVYVCCVH
jgi:hypothetical protein